MKHVLRRTTAILIAVAMVMSALVGVTSVAPQAAEAQSGPNAFRDAGRLGQGVNVAYERPDGRNFKTRPVRDMNAIWDDIADRGFDHVRLAVDFNRHAARVGNRWVVKLSFLRDLRVATRNARARGLIVILDMHGVGNAAFHRAPANNRVRFVQLWESIGRYFRLDGNIYYQLINEPTGPTLPTATTAAQRAANLTTTNNYSGAVNRFYTQATRALRAVNANQPILVSPIFFNNIFEIPRLRMPTLEPGVFDPRVIIDVHFYDPLCFTHQGADWLAGSLDAYVADCQPTGKTWQAAFAQDPFADDAAQEAGKEAWMQAAFDSAQQFAQVKNAPVYMGEFGTNDPSHRGPNFRSPAADRLAWTRAVVANAANHNQGAGSGINWAYWEYEASFGLCNNGRWNVQLLNTLIPGQTPGPCEAAD